MSPQAQEQTKPEEVLPRFCGYCGRSFNFNQSVFLQHVHVCEKTLVDKYYTKRGKSNNGSS
jgi:hypothetical protein